MACAETLGLDIQIVCIRRELAMRERVYPKWVAARKMKQETADHELTVMAAVLETLRGLRDKMP